MKLIKWISQSSAWLYFKGISDLKKQLIKFTLIGFSAVLVDLSCYYLFLQILPEKPLGIANEALAKAISFVCGMAVTYSFNKYWTWKETNRSRLRLIKFSALYGTSLVFNVGVNSLLIFLLYRYSFFAAIPYKYFIAFAGATGFSSLINFTGQKFWVFRK
jgi:putative flippase GtrA